VHSRLAGRSQAAQLSSCRVLLLLLLVLVVLLLLPPQDLGATRTTRMNSIASGMAEAADLARLQQPHA
jgi:hypothetical protein